MDINNILKCLRKEEEYSSLPPKGPANDLPSLTNEEIESLQNTVYGSDLSFSLYAYYSLSLIENDYRPKEVDFPPTKLIDGLDIYSIDGSNQKFSHPSFFFILARAALIRFTYTSNKKHTDVFSLLKKDLSGVILVDGNIFAEELDLFVQIPPTNNDHSFDIMPILNNKSDEPLLIKYNPDSSNKVASSQALGCGVKFQQGIELSMLEEIPTDKECIVIRDGPLLSTSVTLRDTISGLSSTFKWTKQILMCVSKRIGESTFITELLLHNKELRDLWFPDQEITDSTLKSLASDQIIIGRILKPGFRTPWIEAIGRARYRIVEQETGLAPLACYYMSRHWPHTVIRIEIPKFMWEQNKERVNNALSIVAWQLDLGTYAPYIQLQADSLCQLNSEIHLLRDQINAKLYENKLKLPEVFA